MGALAYWDWGGEPMRVTLLSGGVGGAKLALGLYTVLPPGSLTLIANTGDDLSLFGLRICPDLDTLAYTLSGRVSEQQGWGVQGDAYSALEVTRELGGTGWFNLGDKDLGLHLFRTEALRAGQGLTEVTRRIVEALNLNCTLLPMCDQPVPTHVLTDRGDLHFQEYLVRERTEPLVRGIRFRGVDRARPAPGIAEALEHSDLVILAPSNPLISIAPILSVPGMRELLRAGRGHRVAVTPLVGGRSLKGPTDTMMTQLGLNVSPVTVAELYGDVIQRFVLDEVDAALEPQITALGVSCSVLPTVMSDLAAKQLLARALLRLAV
ncbi:MAG: 2-phospho-L-lactate transferase [Deltaproteobacteria bacterium]|nr:2-phospho-L-lactate transferase [Deltaproteobacteria bacterium]